MMECCSDLLDQPSAQRISKALLQGPFIHSRMMEVAVLWASLTAAMFFYVEANLDLCLHMIQSLSCRGRSSDRMNWFLTFICQAFQIMTNQLTWPKVNFNQSRATVPIVRDKTVQILSFFCNTLITDNFVKLYHFRFSLIDCRLSVNIKDWRHKVECDKNGLKKCQMLCLVAIWHFICPLIVQWPLLRKVHGKYTVSQKAQFYQQLLSLLRLQKLKK